LSLSLALYPYFQNTPASVVRSEVMKNARKALELDPTLAQPHIAMGLALQHDNEWGAAGAQFDSAVRLAPHDVEARVQYGRHLLFRGRTADALAQFQAARADDPASSLVLGWVAYTFFVAKKLDSARVISERALQSNSLNLSSVAQAARMHLAFGDTTEARQLAALVPPNFPVGSYVRTATGISGPREVALAQSSSESTNRPWMLNTIRAYTLLGEHDTTAAVDAFEAATAAKEIWTSLLPVTDPLFDAVRGDRRFQTILKRVGLSP
jgi:tetratricopeptide (TPR) repeat protein